MLLHSSCSASELPVFDYSYIGVLSARAKSVLRGSEKNEVNFLESDWMKKFVEQKHSFLKGYQIVAFLKSNLPAY